MDKLTHLPDTDSYSFTDGIEVLRAKLDGPAGRYRTGIFNAAIELNAQWTCDEEQYEHLRSVYRQHVDEGHAPFPMDLFVDSGLYVEHNVRIKPGTFGLSSHRGLSYIVGCVLEVQPQPKATSTTPLEKFAIPPDKDGYSFQDTAEVFHQALDGGLGRVRRDLVGTTTLLNVRWSFSNPAIFAYFRAYYAQWVANPAQGFPIDLFIDNVALEEFTCQFVPGSVKLESVNGLKFVVSAQLEAYKGAWPYGLGTDKVGCDCSHIAWLTGFEVDAEDFMDVGDATLGAYGDGEGSGRSPPLWQDASLLLGFDSADEMIFTNPAVAIAGQWTVRYSIKANADAYQPSDIYLLRMYGTDGEQLSVLLDHDDSSGGYKMFVTYKGSTFGFPFPLTYLQRHDIEIANDNGYLYVFVDGVLQYSYNFVDQATTDITSITWFRPGYNYNARGTWLDEVRVQNIVEHTGDYVVDDLPFCRCDHTEPEVANGVTIETRGPSFWEHISGDVAARVGASTIAAVEDPLTADDDELSANVFVNLAGGKFNVTDRGLGFTGGANSTRQNVGSGAFDFGLEIVIGNITDGVDFACGLVAYGFAPVDKDSWLYGYENMLAGIVQKVADSTCYVTGYGGTYTGIPKLQPGDVVHMIGYATFDVYINGVNIYAIAQPANSAQAAPFVSYKG